MVQKFQKFRSAASLRMLAVAAIVAAAFMSVVPSALAVEEGGTTLGEAFNAKSTGEEILTKLGPVGVAIVAVMVAVLVFTIGLHFFRRNSKSVAK
jgi:hypothetical protein